MPSAKAYAIYAVDPGGTTGVVRALVDLRQLTVAACIRRSWRKGLLKTWTVQGDYIEQCWTICRDATDWFYNVHIERELVRAGHESFTIENFNLRQMGADLTPLRIISGVEVLLAGAYGLEGDFARHGFYVKQSASEAKGFCTDDMIKRWGLWKGRTPHERDAIRHLARRIDRLMVEGA